MKILLCPDSYKGSLTALEVAEAMEGKESKEYFRKVKFKNYRLPMAAKARWRL